MLKLFRVVSVSASVLAGSMAAASPTDSTRGFASGYLNWSVTEGDRDGIVSTGANQARAEASLEDVFDAIAVTEIARLTLLNVSEGRIRLSIRGSGYAVNDGFIETELVGFDSAASLLLFGPGISVAVSRSLRGLYTCTNGVPQAPGQDCFGLNVNGDAAGFKRSLSLVLAPGESATYEFRASARAALGPGVAAVPLPAGGGFLAAGLGLLALLRCGQGVAMRRRGEGRG